MIKKPRHHQAKCMEAAWKALNKSPDPILLDLTVGFGKSLICAWIAQTLEQQGRSTLILTMTSDLVDQNSQEFRDIHGKDSFEPAVMCSKLGLDTWQRPTLFATPQSLWSKIKAHHEVSGRHFDLLAIDEAHNVNAENHETVYMKLIHHYLRVNPKMRIVGMTGTAYRGKTSIVSDDLLFKKCVYKRSLQEEIADGNLLPLNYGIPKADGIDFSDCKQTRLGKYREADLDRAIAGAGRLTGRIVTEVREVVRDGGYKGAFIFGATKEHCDEIMSSLPSGISRLVTGDTPDAERIQIMRDAKAGTVKYLVSMNCLFTGVNIPHYGVVAWLRPTESMIMWNQGNGRVVRKCDDIGKDHGLVLDYAGNLDRFGDSDDEGIIEYQQRLVEENDNEDYELDCPLCGTLNLLDARRCVGVAREWDCDLNRIKEVRCDHYFQFVECPECQGSNDLTARNCRHCGAEIIDPNKKLSRTAARKEPQWGLVLATSYSVHKGKKGKPDTVRVDYVVGNEHFDNPMITEWFSPSATGYAREKFLENFARKFAPNNHTVLTGTAEEIVAVCSELRAPTKLHFIRPKGEKYFNVLAREW